ncbi:MAG TPA: hypothetical protein VH062_04670 [Polyangiaceae bacterium]|jgi:hypothetical protein|nr:hypothetical protein [Polyangiaceae bacterium]
MTPRRRRIERILEHRKKELDEAAAVLSAVRVREAAAKAESEDAEQRAKDAAESRRRLADKGSGVMEFIEAEEWLYATSRRAERAYQALLAVQREVEKVQVVVAEARTRMKQAEQLATRVDLQEKKVADRRERRRDDEAAARIAQRAAAVGGDR